MLLRNVVTFPNGNSGFTLIELLVVVSIIGLLSVLLVAGIPRYMKEANAIKCAANLKFFASQAALYSADNGGEIPIYDKNGRGWQRVLSDYPGTNFDNFQKYMCPEYVRKIKGQGKSVPSPIWWTGYCANRYFADRSGVAGAESALRNNFQSPGLRQQITSPSKTPLFFDNNAGDPSGGEAYAGYAEDGKAARLYSLWPAHNGGFNIAFFDGHVERVKFNDEGAAGNTGSTKGKGAIDYPQFVWKPY